MALVKIGKCFPVHTRENYETRRPFEYAKFDSRTEYRKDGMIYCKKCHEPKVADFPEYNFVIKCSCKCDHEAWERAKKGYSRPKNMRIVEVRAGDWNPFE